MSEDLLTSLRSGCATLGLDPDAAQYDRLLAYLDLLVKWNGAYNLTAVRDPRQMVTRHILDSLAISPHLSGARFIDVGSGAGLPGVPLAILFRDREWHLLDSNGKKTRFLFQVKTVVGLDNMSVHHARVESFQPAEPFDGVMSRAFAALEDMIAGCRHLPGPGGRFYAMKGTFPERELESVDALCEIRAVHPIAVPGLQEQRNLVEMTLRRDSNPARKGRL